MTLQIKLIALALAIAALGAAFFGYGHHQYTKGVSITTAAYESALNKQKAEAAELLATETAKVRGAEQALQTIKNNQELQDADHQKTVANLSDRLRSLAGPTGRLRDPNAPGCGLSSSGAPPDTAAAPGDSADHPAQTGGLLSVQLSDLLIRVLREADDINDAYSSCRADAYAVRGQGDPPAPADYALPNAKLPTAQP